MIPNAAVVMATVASLLTPPPKRIAVRPAITTTARIVTIRAKRPVFDRSFSRLVSSGPRSLVCRLIGRPSHRRTDYTEVLNKKSGFTENRHRIDPRRRSLRALERRQCRADH